MDLAVKTETRLDDALDELARNGGHLSLTREGRAVAYLLTPEALERLEDERDSALLEAARLRGPTGEAVSLQELAVEFELDLDDLKAQHPIESFRE